MENTRRCIKCDVAMERKLVEEVELDWCPSCHGLWLDRDEIQQLVAKSDTALEELRRLVQQQRGSEEARSGSPQPCPACQGKLSVALLGMFNIEHCTACGGIFLDRGELERMIQLIRDRQNRVASIVALARSVLTAGIVDR